MKICYVTQSGFGFPSAEQTHALEMIRALRKLGHEVIVMYAGDRGALAELDVEESKAPFGRRGLSKVLFQVWLLFALRKAYRSGRFDVCYTRQSALMAAPGLVARWTGMPVIAEFNTYYIKKETTRGNRLLEAILRAIESNNLKNATLIIVISELLRDLILENYTVPESRIVVCHNGANVDFMRPMSASEARARYGIDGDDFVVGFVGHLHPWQGITQTLEAFQKLLAEEAHARLVVVGTSKDAAAYKKLAAKLGIAERVVWLGSVSYENVPAVIATFDVAVAPGDTREGVRYEMRSPLKVYEYMSCGKPVVAGRLQTIERYFDQNQAGFMIPRGSVDAMARALILLAKQTDLRQAMGRRAREIAVAEFSWQSIASGLLASYRQLNNTSAASGC